MTRNKLNGQGEENYFSDIVGVKINIQYDDCSCLIRSMI